MEPVGEIFESFPYDEYRRSYNMSKEYYEQVGQENYFLTKEQIEETFGDNNFLMNDQLESIYRDLILNELQYRHVSLITVCQDPSKVYQELISYSQTKVNLD